MFAIYDHPEDKKQSRLLETYSCAVSALLSQSDAFTYPDTTNITLEVTQNNDKSVVTTDGVKNQAVAANPPHNRRSFSSARSSRCATR